MTTVQKFDRSMIEKFLKKRDLKYLVDRDGDYRIDFSYDPDIQCELTVWLIAGGSDHDIYNVLITSNKRIAKSDWGRAIFACNTWNKERRWPKAYLDVSDPNKDSWGYIALEHQILLSAGIHQELLDNFTDTVILGGYSFWEWAAKEQGL